MARPKKQSNEPTWAICVRHPDDTCGWLLDENTEVKTYPTQEEAEKSLKQLKRNTKYSWSLPVEVKEFTR